MRSSRWAAGDFPRTISADPHDRYTTPRPAVERKPVGAACKSRDGWRRPEGLEPPTGMAAGVPDRLWSVEE
ncbi:MAG: hypothetical protein ABSD51_05600, partial [Candidatus Binatus sp.]